MRTKLHKRWGLRGYTLSEYLKEYLISEWGISNNVTRDVYGRTTYEYTITDYEQLMQTVGNTTPTEGYGLL